MADQEEKKTIHLKCRNPSGKCESIVAEEIPIPAGGVRMYRCVKCGHSWPINVGGQANLNAL